MIIVFTGNGKGKTTAAVGQAIRAHAAGLKVGFVQFMKRFGQAGEQFFLKELLGERYSAEGIGFFLEEKDAPRHREAVLRGLERAWELIESGIDMLVLDEILYALGNGLALEGEVSALMEASEARCFHLVLTGRGLPDFVERKGDLITEMREVRHPYAKGIKAGRGIEF